MITIIIVILTCITSYKAFNDQSFMNKLIFFPYGIARSGQYHRFLSSGFIHANWMHLLVNMYVLYEFGQIVELFYGEVFGQFGSLLYIILYFGGIIMADIGTYFKHKEHSYYRSLGASGAVSGVVFAFILFHPWADLGLLFIPGLKFPAIAGGILYLIYSAYAARNTRDNINHDAHFYGAIFGVVFTAAMKPDLLKLFFEQITNFNM